MPRDFTTRTYTYLLNSFLEANYEVQTFQNYLLYPLHRVIILRHDVDKRPQSALRIADIENKLGIKSTFYFRIIRDSFNIDIIKRIIDLGHEIGYHYEDLTIARGDINQACSLFENNLQTFRKYYPVKTICMHGSPLSKWDNRVIWNYINYKDYDIIGEPYYDIDYNEVLYLTDTGRHWNNEKISVRDKVNSSVLLSINSTFNLCEIIKIGNIYDKILLNTHPQRWSDNLFEWVFEYYYQGLKNIIKRIIFVKE
jgi:hypothetical protein